MPKTSQPAPALPPLVNALGLETSPYLLQHRNNPVHWQPWGVAALDRAQRENKPILLSVGYAACHWCHVMAHESFEDVETARLMNSLYVNIKVDREERPDIDAIYQSALALLGQQGGWPLTVFLTPTGKPFWGGTYFPPEDRYGQPDFKSVLQRISEVYTDDPEAVKQNCTALLEGLDRLSRGRQGNAPDLSFKLLDHIAERFGQEIDPVNGGVGGAPKFPQPGILEFLWRAHLRTGNAAFRQHVLLTLDHMCQGGIYDHLGGGFSRYATDESWLIPHFEKMLYDNALLTELLTLAWQDTGSRLYETRVRETVAWVLREMVVEGGGFASSLDADSDGGEGRFYVWSAEEITDLLGSGARTFAAAYDVTSEGNWEGRTILHRNHRPSLGDERAEAELARLRQILFTARAQRIRPGRDDKVLADWNGLTIRALAFAGGVFGEPEWIAAAERAFAFIADTMTRGGRLAHAARRGQARHSALLDDYANMASAALTLHEASPRDDYLDRARDWVAILDRHYWDAASGGYFYTAADAETLITRTRSITDNALPSGNGTMIDVLGRLYCLTGELPYRDRAEAILHAFATELGHNFFPLATFLNGFEALRSRLQAIIVGHRDEPGTAALIAAINSASLPARLLTVITPDATLPPDHPATGKVQVAGMATAYLCLGTTCSPPITNPDQLEARLRGAQRMS